MIKGHPNKTIQTETVAETFTSFAAAVSLAGGAPFSIDRMKELTLYDFMLTVAAPNGIRFTYKRPANG